MQKLFRQPAEEQLIPSGTTPTYILWLALNTLRIEVKGVRALPIPRLLRCAQSPHGFTLRLKLNTVQEMPRRIAVCTGNTARNWELGLWLRRALISVLGPGPSFIDMGGSVS